MDKDDIIRCTDPADPRRCQHTGSRGQCTNLSVEGGNKCPAHGGILIQRAQDRRSTYEIRSAQVRASLQRHASNPEILRLEEEIGVIRMIIEAHLNQIEDPSDLLRKSTSLQGLINSVEKLVTSYERTLARCGQMIDKPALTRFAANVATTAAQYIQDPASIGKFMQDVVALVEDASTN